MRAPPAISRAWPALRRACTGAALAVLCSGCAHWLPLQRFDGWTLYVQDGSPVDAGRFRAAFEPAFAVVEDALGPFAKKVDVYAWEGGVDLDGSGGGRIRHGAEEDVEEVPGIGPTKVRAFHSRGGGGLFSTSGVFVGAADTGTAVHELVHARLAEIGTPLPMWLEEGLACVLGDGFQDGERWIVDGLACWPLRELRDVQLSDAELARLLALRPRDDIPMRDNVLVHFVGWAVAFDLHRETGDFDWRRWLVLLGSGEREVRVRLERTLDPATTDEWLRRLEDPRPEIRLAAAKGLWKLRSRDVIDALLDRLDQETDDAVRVGLALNALGATGEVRLGRDRWRRLWRSTMPVLAEAELADPAEQEALRDLHSAYRSRRRGPSPEESMRKLERFWRE